MIKANEAKKRQKKGYGNPVLAINYGYGYTNQILCSQSATQYKPIHQSDLHSLTYP